MNYNNLVKIHSTCPLCGSEKIITYFSGEEIKCVCKVCGEVWYI